MEPQGDLLLYALSSTNWIRKKKRGDHFSRRERGSSNAGEEKEKPTTTSQKGEDDYSSAPKKAAWGNRTSQLKKRPSCRCQTSLCPEATSRRKKRESSVPPSLRKDGKGGKGMTTGKNDCARKKNAECLRLN